MKLFAGSALLAGLLVAGAANASTVVFSENFEEYNPQAIAHGATSASAGGNSITTDYSYRVPGNGNGSGDADSMYDEGTWSITTNPNLVHNLWVDLPVADQTGQMLILNGSTQAGSTVLGDPNADPVAYLGGDIAVSAGSYTFSYNLLNVCCTPQSGIAHTPSVLDLWYTPASGPISFTELTIDTTSVQSNGWGLITGSFSLSQGGTIRLGLSDLADQASGNDFAVDNIKLTAVPEPASWALMIVGFGAAGAMLRRRQGLATA